MILKIACQGFLMIFYSDGIFPLWGLIIVFIVLYSLIKESKGNRIRQKRIDELKANADEFSKAVNAVNTGAKVLKLDDYKHLDKSDLEHFVNNRGVKFI